MSASTLFYMTGVECEKERLANSVVSLLTVSSGSAAERVDPDALQHVEQGDH